MDFTPSEEQSSIRDLARGIFEKEVTPERVKTIELREDWFDRELWATLAEAGLLGLAVPESQGGMGFGILEVCVLLEEIGRVVVPLPALPTLLLGAMPIARFGTEAQKSEWLGPVAAGDRVLTAALVDAGSADVAQPATRAVRDGDAWILDGTKRFVLAGGIADRVLVPARTSEGCGIFLVDPSAAGVTITAQRVTSNEPVYMLDLAGVRVSDEDLLGGDAAAGGTTASWLHDHALVGIAATQAGVCERALEMTSRYVSERVQFGVPIGSFQAVQHRSADAYMDVLAMRWVTWRAAWKLHTGEDASREAWVAKFWAAEAGSRVVNATQHLHGGIGADVDYPVHRYFLWSKTLELALGSAMQQLAELGQDMARTGPQEQT